VVLAAVAADEDLAGGQMMCWDVQSGSILPQHVWREAAVQDACLLPSMARPLLPGYVVSVAPRTSAIHIYSLQKERPLARWYGHDRIRCVAASQDGRWLAAGNEAGSLFLWDLSSGALHGFVATAHLQRVSKVEFSADGAVVITASEDGWVKVWPVASLLSERLPKALLSFGDHKKGVDTFYIGFGGASWRTCRLLTASSDKTLALYDLADGARLASFAVPSVPARVLMDAAETKIFAGCQDGNIYVFDLAADNDDIARAALQATSIGQANVPSRYRLAGSGKAVTGLCWTPDERLLIASDAGGKVTFWDPVGGRSTRQVSAASVVPGGSIRWLQVVPKEALSQAAADQFPLLFPQLRRQRDDDATAPASYLHLNNVGAVTADIMASNASEDESLRKDYGQLKEEHARLLAAHAALLKATSEMIE
jgi:pre-rRNA-processing protein IPI3